MVCCVMSEKFPQVEPHPVNNRRHVSKCEGGKPLELRA
jgi:hypothetical protein